MPLDDLDGSFSVPTRDEIATKFRRDYGIVSPESDTSDGTQPDVQAKTLAITLLPIYSDAVLITGGINEDEATGARLDRVGARYGVPRPQAVGASGYVAVSAADSGGTIQEGDEIKNRQTKKRYEAAETKYVVNGGLIRIRGIDTGPATNLAEGVTLQWSSPRPGIGQTATIFTGGLTGGADVADDATYLPLIQEARRNPPNGNNEAAVQRAVRSTPGLAIGAVFTYACVFGPGTLAFAFLLSTPAGSDPVLRIPNAAQRAAALAWMTGQLGGDDSYFCAQVAASPEPFSLRVTWDLGSPGWQDAVPWPAFRAKGLPPGNSGAVVVLAAGSATSFTLGAENADYTGAASPQAGQTIAFWDSDALLFRRKIIAHVTGAGPWTIDCLDSGANGSDTSYVPRPSQRAMPWSDSLSALIQPTLSYFSKLGPGEMFASFSDEGRRQRRNPKPPKMYPQAVSTDAILPILALANVQSATLVEGGAPVPVGYPGIHVNMRTLSELSVFP